MDIGQLWLFALLSTGAAGLYAILAFSVTINYKATGFVSFANGAIAMITAYVFLNLRHTGMLVFPIPGLNTGLRISTGEAPVGLALLISFVFALLLGLVTYLAVFRWLRNSPPLARLVASIGLMVTLQSLAVLKFGTTGQGSAPLFTPRSTQLFGARVGFEQIIVLGVAVAITAVLIALYRLSRFGIRTTACAENPVNAVLAGFRPVRSELVNWTISAGLCGLAGCLATSFVSLDPSSYTLLIVPALAVAVAGRFEGFGVSLGVAIVLALAQSEASLFAAHWSWFPQRGVPDALPFIVITAILVAKGRQIPQRGAEVVRRLPQVGQIPRMGPALAVSLPLGLVLIFVLHGQYRVSLIQSMVVAILCLSLVVVTGYLGQVSLAQMSFAGFGAFVLARFLGSWWDLPAPLALIVGGVAAVPLGILAALPALRVRGIQLAVTTFAAAIAVDGLIFTNPRVSGGFAGLRFPSPEILGLNLNIQSDKSHAYPRVQFALLTLGALTVIALLVANLRRQALGRQMLVVRASERVAAASGISVIRTKLSGYAFASFIAGVGGAMIGYKQGIITAGSFSALLSLSLLAVAFLGGIGYVSGAIAGGIVFGAAGLVFTLMDHYANFGKYQTLIVGLGLILTAILNPDGSVSPAAGKVTDLLNRRSQRRSDAEQPGAASTPLQIKQLTSDTAFELRGFGVRYGRTMAVGQVNLAVGRGEIVGLIGPNGAGKTSLVDGATGFTASEGAIFLDGVDVSAQHPHQIARAGVSRTFQADELLTDMTVLDNVLAASSHGRGTGLLDIVRLTRPRTPPAVRGALDAVGMTNRSGRLVTELNPRERKLVAIARALAQAPKLLIVDEPAAGLDRQETRELAQLLRTVRDAGMSILVIDHDMDFIMSLCDRVSVLQFGRQIATGPPEDVRRDDAVIAAYLGPGADTSELDVAERAPI